MNNIHSTAIISKNAIIGDNIEIGPYTIIKDKVTIRDDVFIQSNVLIEGRTVIGDGCQISHSAVIGTPPQDLKYKGADTEVIIGKDTIIREFVTINRATGEGGRTIVGDNCFLMAYVHIAHNCKLGNNVILANAVNLAGYVEIEDNAIVGGMTPVHQFVKIGTFAFVGGFSRVTQDIVPYTIGAGVPYRTVGLNTIGLKRNNFPEETINLLKKAVKIVFYSRLNTSQSIEKIEDTLEVKNELALFVNFIKSSKRGIAK